ncbi:hypothetical protein LS684_06640 [Cytobacillus spongiae]|jgi:chromosome condensin MukBEF complex kleisin-like MukF subunit|uniref:hypothetical protein n=1 Tax=Cytobacillus spongiae TaxID=2901381 RepID=UPI001F1BA7D7|nr:hypothetical protein [Cytobacillus spongiae]UII57113.1 hypothetical protein LS684_06640 [Cytobacillus spongiae]
MFWENIDGINLWSINKKLKKLASSRMEIEEKTRNHVLTIQLPSKRERELTVQTVKEELIEKIKKLDGFETLQVCLLENCEPVLKEQLTQYGVFRWIEIPIEQSVEYEFSFDNIKGIKGNTYSINAYS